jgi:hypothetical protein
VQPSEKGRNFRDKKVGKFRQISRSKNVITTGGSPGGGSPAPVVPQQQPSTNAAAAAAATSAAAYGPGRPGLAAAQHQSIEGQGLSMPIIAIQNAISWSNSEPQNKFSSNLAASTSKCWKTIQKSTKNFQKRSKFSRQKVGKFRQILRSKNVIRMVLERSRKKFSHKYKISNKIPKKLLKHDNPNKTDALVVNH